MKSEETKRQEREILKSFGVQGKGTPGAKRSSGSDRSENKRSNEPGKEKNVCLLR